MGAMSYEMGFGSIDCQSYHCDVGRATLQNLGKSCPARLPFPGKASRGNPIDLLLLDAEEQLVRSRKWGREAGRHIALHRDVVVLT